MTTKEIDGIKVTRGQYHLLNTCPYCIYLGSIKGQLQGTEKGYDFYFHPKEKEHEGRTLATINYREDFIILDFGSETHCSLLAISQCATAHPVWVLAKKLAEEEGLVSKAAPIVITSGELDTAIADLDDVDTSGDEVHLYEVYFSRTTYQSGYMRVIARSPEEARKLADASEVEDWETTDTDTDNAYIDEVYEAGVPDERDYSYYPHPDDL